MINAGSRGESCEAEQTGDAERGRTARSADDGHHSLVEQLTDDRFGGRHADAQPGRDHAEVQRAGSGAGQLAHRRTGGRIEPVERA
jgi:hypothetical protein